MDPRIRERLDAKTAEAAARVDEIEKITASLDPRAAPSHAVVAGMLYNSFYYQTRRICGRDPTEDEVSEFLSMLSGLHDRIENDLD